MTRRAMSIGSQMPARRRRGFVLVTVLFISTILLGSAAAFAMFARQEMRRVSEEAFSLESRSLASVACSIASDWIAGDNNAFDSELEFYYDQEHPFFLTFGEWDVSISISPLSRLIQINGLFLPDGVTLKTEYEYAWAKFWNLAGDDRLGPLILDFLDADTEARPGSHEGEHYKNRRVSDLSELLHIDGITTEMLFAEPGKDAVTVDSFFTASGTNGMINVNVAPKHVLEILDADVGSDVAASIIAYRRDNAIADEKDLLKIPGFPMAAYARLSNIISYKSRFFLIQMKTSHAHRERNYEIIVEKSGNGCKIVRWEE